MSERSGVREGSELGRERRVLDPEDRVSEVLFGLIMALSFTGAIEVGAGGEAEVRELLVAAVGCNIAWGLVDGVMYALLGVVERGRHLALARAYVDAPDEAAQRRLLAARLPDGMVELVQAEGLARLRESLRPRLGERARLRLDDLRGALAVFLLVVLATFPVVLPFLFLEDTWSAKRLSNAIAVGMMFACGAMLGRRAGVSPWRVGLGMVALGVVLVVAIVALGG